MDLIINLQSLLHVSFLSAPLFYLLPEKLQYCDIIVSFILFILLLVYFCIVVTWEKIKLAIIIKRL